MADIKEMISELNKTIEALTKVRDLVEASSSTDKNFKFLHEGVSYVISVKKDKGNE